MQPEARGHLLVVLEVAEALAEFSRCWFPHQRRRYRIEVIVELSRAHPEGAQVVADHRLVAQGRGDIALGPEAARIGRAEELVRHQAIVDTEPEWEITFGGTHPRERGNTTGESEILAE